jgi:hypothetical protein
LCDVAFRFWEFKWERWRSGCAISRQMAGGTREAVRSTSAHLKKGSQLIARLGEIIGLRLEANQTSLVGRGSMFD